MNDQFDITVWRESFAQGLSDLGMRLASGLASVALGLLIVAVGWGLAWAVSFVAERALRVAGLDRVATRFAPVDLAGAAGIYVHPSQVVGRLVFWVVFLSFALLGVETFGLTVIAAAADQVLSYLPNLARAAIVVLLGLLLLRFLGTIVTSVASANSLPKAARLGFLVQALVGGLVLVMAVEQLGMPIGIFVAPFTALVATIGFTAGLAFALGAKPIITHILAGHFLRESLPRNVFVEIKGERGIVERVGSTDTVIRGDEKRWSVPNARLLDEIVVR